MAVFAIYIQKETSYFGETRRFGNTYHFTTDIGEPFSDVEAANQCKNAERNITGTDVQFVGWRSWGPTDGSEFDNVMRDDGEFDEPGQAPYNAAGYREACLLIAWPLSRSEVHNRKRWLRKFIRMGGPNGTAVSDAQVAGVAPLSGSEQTDVFNNYIDGVTDLSAMGDFRLCTDTGDVPTGPGFVRPYYYTRQIGR